VLHNTYIYIRDLAKFNESGSVSRSKSRVANYKSVSGYRGQDGLCASDARWKFPEGNFRISEISKFEISGGKKFPKKKIRYQIVIIFFPFCFD